MANPPRVLCFHSTLLRRRQYDQVKHAGVRGSPQRGRIKNAMPLELKAFRRGTLPNLPVPAPRTRLWMDGTRLHAAYRCLPMVMANQAGWHLLNSHAFEAVWDGGDGEDAIDIRVLSGEGPCPVTSHFGHGVLTWSIPFLFRTPPGFNLLARGPANLPKDGVSALEGLVETDWAVSPFTMNWKITRPGHPVRFEEAEPICFLVPQRRGELEAFEPVVEDLETQGALYESYQEWRESRSSFLTRLRSSQLPTDAWEKHYVQGRSPGGGTAREHQTKLELKPFPVA
jgi:hypothetical protein